ncbi:hypothetical protein B0F90DRAFT_1824048 [Multifurca ochricompacta]|uniref:CFEM domain-containing protein n=1 Tax=Multifurca ochricompacta TaxID=376703 RepID=A0AAD4QJ65_9AGAM|nr:hypothetical protein B0F90DRAFT_1824048 [Multifurca ochricompacta]
MFVNPLHFFVAFAVAAVGVSGQAGLDSCIIGCLQGAVSSNTCASFTDVACVCSNTAFQQAAATCLTSKCTTQDQQTAQQLQQQQCGTSSASSAASSASSGSAVASSSKPVASSSKSATSPATSSTSTTSAASSSTSSKPNSATHIEQVPFLTAAVAIAGVALGGAFIL